MINVNTTCNCSINASEYLLVSEAWTGTPRCSGLGRPCGGSMGPFSTGCNCAISGPPPAGGSCGAGFSSVGPKFFFRNFSVASAGTYRIEAMSNLTDGTLVGSENATVNCVQPNCAVDIRSTSCAFSKYFLMSFKVYCRWATNYNISIQTSGGEVKIASPKCDASATYVRTGWGVAGVNNITVTAYKAGALCATDTANITCKM